MELIIWIKVMLSELNEFLCLEIRLYQKGDLKEIVIIMIILFLEKFKGKLNLNLKGI